MLPPQLAGFTSYADWLRSREGYGGQAAFVRLLPARPPITADYRGGFGGVLEVLGLAPYQHQAQALHTIEGGDHLVLAASTAAGKSLVFQVPVLKAALEGQTALLLYPTKALAHDQQQRLWAQASMFDLSRTVYTYDGDTSESQRKLARAQGQVLLTNPDMLHFGLLAFHPSWAGFLGRLKYIVLDELHAYRGVFGTHVALILRRLLRLARHYGASPQIIATSATIGNPAEHAHHLTGETFVEQTAQFSRAEREFVIWQPRALDREGKVRRSPNLEAALLARQWAQAGLRGLVFANSRRTAELVARYAAHPGVQPYRSGYTPQDRRRLEDSLKSGEVQVLITTNALELGLDIGGLDGVVLLGYPGSVSAFWQRGGRAGRGDTRALVVWIPREDPLDAYLLERPDWLLASPPEAAVCDPFNPVLYPPHLHCAAREWPIDPREEIYQPLLATALNPRPQATNSPDDPGFRLYTSVRQPHQQLTLRGMGGTYRLRNNAGQTLGSMDQRQAYWEAHPGAVYLHMGQNYLVRNLDPEQREIVLLPGLEDYYTQPRTLTEIEVLEGWPLAGGAWTGRVRLREQVIGFVKKRYIHETILEEVNLALPEITFETEAVWFHPPEEAVSPVELPGAIHALEHTLIGLLPLLVLAERADVGGVSYPLYPQPLASGQGATVFIYDGYPGGVGYARAAGRQFGRWLQLARHLLESCPCTDGCPRCTLSPKCGNGNQPLDKAAALGLARILEVAAQKDGDRPLN